MNEKASRSEAEAVALLYYLLLDGYDFISYRKALRRLKLDDVAGHVANQSSAQRGEMGDAAA